MLKINYHTLVASILLVGNSTLLASPLLTKTSYPGYSSPELALYTTCMLDDKGFLVIKNELNGIITQEKKTLTINSASIKKSIAKAALGKVTRQSELYITTPYVEYIAYQKQYYGKFQSVYIWEDNGVTEENGYNDSLAALTLRKLLDTICK